MRKTLVVLFILASILFILFNTPIQSYAEEEEHNKVFTIKNKN